MSRFYVPKGSVEGDRIVITGDEAHHIRDVMRLKAHCDVVAFDGTGNEYIGVIRSIDPKSVVIEITQKRRPQEKESFAITLIQAIPKKEKMDYIVEKATELGASRIIPVMTDRTIVDWDRKKRDSSVERWKRISLAASKQCGRLDIPDISPVVDFKALMKSGSRWDMALLAALSEGATGLKKAIAGFKKGSVAIAIGPEGDFTPEEIASAQNAGFRLVDLGRRVLKSDTAGLAVLAILDHELSS